MTPVVALKRLATFHSDELHESRSLVALEHLGSWTGGLLPDTELPTAVAGQSGVAAVEPGDVLFGKLRPYLAKGLLVEQPMAASTELICIRANAGTDSRFLGYVTRSAAFVEWSIATSEGTKMPRTSWEKLSEFAVRLPAVTEQRAIAAYLDAETARIDALIAKKQQLIQLLENRWEARLDERVKGPEHRLRRAAVFVDYRGKTPEKSAAGVPLITASHIKNGSIAHELDPQFLSVDVYASWMRRGWPEAGDVVMTTEAPLGEVAQVVDPRIGLAQRVILLKPRPALADGSFLSYSLRTSRFRNALLANATGSTALGIKADRLKALPVVLPDLEAQRRIASELSAAEDRKRRLQLLTARQVELLLERRQTLVTAAVTGELSTTGAV